MARPKIAPYHRLIPAVARDQLEDIRGPAVAKMRKKSDLPTKLCVVCGLPFAWRKKWARDWDRVTHCSDRCRAAAKSRRPTEARA